MWVNGKTVDRLEKLSGRRRRAAIFFGLNRPPTPHMAVKWGFRRAGGAKWREIGGTRTPSNVEFPAVSGVVCMSKVGGLDEIYPLTKNYVRWMRFCV